ncbi:MAG: TRAP transporter large permease [Proteobacteria bacterium]|nr:TRAP transporter large permease [Pseudomonadota bacterium]
MLTATTLVLILLVALALPIAVVMGVLALFLDYVYSPLPLRFALGEILWGHSIDFILVAIPLFVLMGELMLRAGIADKMYGAMVQWLSWLPGGLMHANIGTCAAFAATSGSSVATAATIGTVAMPQIHKRGYNERLFLGSLAAGGTLGILIPPSINMIVFGFLTDTSVPQLFLGGIIPGLILTFLYMLVIFFACLFHPEWDGHPEETSWRLRLVSLVDLLPPLGLFLVVVGSIYAGWATPTEAAALGVFCSIALAAVNGRLSFEMVGESLLGTIRTAGMMILILIVSFFLNFVFAQVGLVQVVNRFILGLGLSPLNTMLFIIGIYVILGMFMETLAMVVLTVPIITPVVVSLGYDPVWFGIMVVILSETAILTPPVGMMCFVIQGIRGRGQLNDVFIGVAPFILALAVMMGILLSFPDVALYLPKLFYR